MRQNNREEKTRADIVVNIYFTVFYLYKGQISCTFQ